MSTSPCNRDASGFSTSDSSTPLSSSMFFQDWPAPDTTSLDRNGDLPRRGSALKLATYYGIPSSAPYYTFDRPSSFGPPCTPSSSPSYTSSKIPSRSTWDRLTPSKHRRRTASSVDQSITDANSNVNTRSTQSAPPTTTRFTFRNSPGSSSSRSNKKVTEGQNPTSPSTNRIVDDCCDAAGDESVRELYDKYVGKAERQVFGVRFPEVISGAGGKR